MKSTFLSAGSAPRPADQGQTPAQFEEKEVEVWRRRFCEKRPLEAIDMETYIIEVRDFDSEAICDLRGCLEAADKKAAGGIELTIFLTGGEHSNQHTK